MTESKEETKAPTDSANSEGEDLKAKVQSLQKTLEEREKQLQVSSMQNARLMDLLSKTQSELEEMKSLPFVKGQEALLLEFQTRIQQAEKKVEAMKRERDDARRSSNANSLKKELTDAQNAVAKKTKEAEQLRAEGEALSKKQFTMETTIKKLRSESKTHEDTIKSLQEAKTVAEDTVRQQAKRIAELESNEKVANSLMESGRKNEVALKEAQAAKRDLQNSLDKAWNEITELKKKLEEATKESAEQVRNDMKKSVDTMVEEWTEREHALNAQIEELRATVQKLGEECASKEDNGQQALSELKRRAEAAEASNEELSNQVISATVPLVSQISELEKNLRERSAEYDKNQRESQETIRALQSQLTQTREKLSAVESECSKYKDAISEQTVETQKYKSESEALHGTVQALEQQVKQKNEDIALLRQDIERERETVTEQKKEKDALNEQMKGQEEKRDELQKRYDELSKELIEARQAQVRALSPSTTPTKATSPGFSLTSSGRRSMGTGGNFFGTATMEKFSEALAKKDNEIAALQGQLSSLSSVKLVLEEEVLRLTTDNATLQKNVNEMNSSNEALEAAKKENRSLSNQLESARTRLEEMELDAEDMKQSYRLQLDHLAQEIERLRLQSPNK